MLPTQRISGADTIVRRSGVAASRTAAAARSPATLQNAVAFSMPEAAQATIHDAANRDQAR
ncbi:MAG: hypothetical protein VW405_00095 [Rhodospirillaceae bacterium]